MFCCLQKNQPSHAALQWFFDALLKTHPHMGCVRKSSHEVRETERKIILLPVVHQMAIKKQKQKPKKNRGGGEIFEAAKAQHENGGKTLAGWSWNSHKCNFLYRIHHQPFTCTCYIIAAGKALLTLWDILWVIWPDLKSPDLKLKWEKETVFYLLTKMTLYYVLEPALSPFELNLAITDVHWCQNRRKSWH